MTNTAQVGRTSLIPRNARNTFLAIDLGRYKSVACVYDRGTRGHTFRTVDMTPDAIDRLLASHPGAMVVVKVAPPSDSPVSVPPDVPATE